MQSIRGVSAISGRLSIARATPRKSTNETRRFSLNTSIKGSGLPPKSPEKNEYMTWSFNGKKLKEQLARD